MGEALGVPGNVGPGHERAEWNVWIDPAAAQAVLDSGVPVTLVPLDATNDVPITVDLAGVLRRHRHATPQAAAAWKLLQNTGLYMGGNYFWDPLAAMAPTTSAILRYEEDSVRVDQDGRVRAAAGAARVRVAVAADRKAFEARLLSGLLGNERFSIPRAPAGATLAFDGRGCSYVGPRRGPAGWAKFDTVNRGRQAFTYVLGTLHEGKTAVDLAAAIERADGRLEPPAWFSPESTGQTPPHSRMTWLAKLGPGRQAVVCSTLDPPRAGVVTTVVVQPQR